MTLTKADLTQRVADTVGLNKREAAEMVEGVFEEIAAALAGGNEVKLSGFGSFQVRRKTARPGRNPKTGETAVISARRVVVFHPSHKLKLAAGSGMLPAQSAGAVATTRPAATRGVTRDIEEFV